MDQRMMEVEMGGATTVERALNEEGRDGWHLKKIEPLFAHGKAGGRGPKSYHSRRCLMLLEHEPEAVSFYRAVMVEIGATSKLGSCSRDGNERIEAMARCGYRLVDYSPLLAIGSDPEWPVNPCPGFLFVFASEMDRTVADLFDRRISTIEENLGDALTALLSSSTERATEDRLKENVRAAIRAINRSDCEIQAGLLEGEEDVKKLVDLAEPVIDVVAEALGHVPTTGPWEALVRNVLVSLDGALVADFLRDLDAPVDAVDQQPAIVDYRVYRESLLERYWLYVDRHLASDTSVLDPKHARPTSPPVFAKDAADMNLLTNPDSPARQEALIGLVENRHRWFRSMNSSQALAQSVLGNLKVNGLLHVLSGLTDEDSNEALFGGATMASDRFEMEYAVGCLGEPTPTRLNAFVSGDYQVAVECKFTQTEVGPCSRPLLRRTASNYETDICDGNYSCQRGRVERCPLTAKGVLYWRYVPQLFSWDSSEDIHPCPLNHAYQLVRNILAACVRSDGTVAPDKGHAVLLYDSRNPAFASGGAGNEAFRKTKEALLDPTLLRRCSWQRLIAHLRSQNVLLWLTDALEEKYGF
jgi:hypothetical protein